MQVVMGGVDIEKPEDFDQTVPVERTIIHEDYRLTPLEIYSDIGPFLLFTPNYQEG